jgi:hypothetical protein
MPISNYNTGFPQGVTIRNAPILDLQNGNGNVFWVDSNRGSDDNKGTFTFPLATLLKALTLVKADQGDKIFLAAGHQEEITDATSYDVSTSGIQIIGMGTWTNRSTITFTTIATATLNISAQNVYIGNIYFRNDLLSIDNLISVENGLFTIENCLFSDGSVSVDNFIKIDGSNVKIIGCQLFAGYLGESAISFGTSSGADFQFVDCLVFGNFSNGCIYVPSSSPQVIGLFVDGGNYDNYNTTSYMLYSEISNISGRISDDTNITVYNPEKLIINTVAGSSIGKGKAGDVISFSAIIPVAKVGNSSTYFAEVINGSFYLEDVCVDIPVTGLGGSTNLELDRLFGTYGITDFYSEAITNLGSHTSVSLDAASILGLRASFDAGSRLRVNKTGAALTGTDLKVTYVLRLLEDGSTISTNLSF